MGAGRGASRRGRSVVASRGLHVVRLTTQPVPVFSRVANDEGREGEVRTCEFMGDGENTGQADVSYGVVWAGEHEPTGAWGREIRVVPRQLSMGEKVAELDRDLLGKFVSVDARRVEMDTASWKSREGGRLWGQVAQISAADIFGALIGRENRDLSFTVYFHDDGGVCSFNYKLSDLEIPEHSWSELDVAPVSF